MKKTVFFQYITVILLAVSLGAAFGAAGCGRDNSYTANNSAATAADAEVPRLAEPVAVRLIGLDGATWNVIIPEVRMGKLPNIGQTVRRGVSASLASIEPMKSPRIWTSIATGKTPEKHGIVDFTQMVTVNGESKKRLVTSNVRKVKALWEILSDLQISSSFVAWWASWPAEPAKGPIVSSLGWPFRRTFALREALDENQGVTNDRAFPPMIVSEIDPLNVSADTLPPEDLALVDMDLSDWHYPRDKSYYSHGRMIAAKYQPRVLGLYLQGIDATSHPYWNDSSKIALYYEYTDKELTWFFETATPNMHIILCADHGFQGLCDQPQSLRFVPPKKQTVPPGANPFMLQATPGDHYKFGLLAGIGPLFRTNHTIRRASVMDICPTLLALLDAPLADDMDGRPLANLFLPEIWNSREPKTIATYEDGAKQASDALESPMDSEVMEALRGLGYAL